MERKKLEQRDNVPIDEAKVMAKVSKIRKEILEMMEYIKHGEKINKETGDRQYEHRLTHEELYFLSRSFTDARVSEIYETIDIVRMINRRIKVDSIKDMVK